MNRTLLVSAFIACSSAALAQPCIPNPLYADSVFGVWPDTTQNFIAGQIGIPYSQDLNLIVPVSAQDIDETFPAVNIDSVVFNGVDGLPAGLSVSCASQTAAPCTYLPTVLGCGLVSGTPSEAGFFPLTLNVTGYFSLFGQPVPYPLTFGGYEIFILDPTVVGDLNPVGLAEVRSVPNPANGRSTIEFTLQRGGELRVRVFNLLGDEVWSTATKGKAGLNKVPFEAGEIPDGVYLFKVEGGAEAFTGRMMVNR